jgi:hypothetical protein
MALAVTKGRLGRALALQHLPVCEMRCNMVLPELLLGSRLTLLHLVRTNQALGCISKKPFAQGSKGQTFALRGYGLP